MDIDTKKVQQQTDKYICNTYGRYPVVMVEGSGCRLKDARGREYLDFLSGIAVTSLGHANPLIADAICRQAATLVHVSNLFYTAPSAELAETLVKNSFAKKVFFANSGAEANEAAIKLARKHGNPERNEIITLTGSFHGRTLATVAATGQERFRAGFDPVPTGFRHAPFGDLETITKMIDERTCAIMCEPLQGEGGVRPLATEYLRGIRELCDREGLLLILDEVQVGLGRTGRLFGYEHFDIVPDIITLAKALGNGMPIGAMLAGEKVADTFVPGDHASTFGANPVVTAAANQVMATLLEDGFLARVEGLGHYLAKGLSAIAQRFPEIVSTVRGLGLIQGMVLSPVMIPQGGEMVRKLLENGLIANFAGNTALRFLPPLTVSRSEIDQACEIIEKTLAGFQP